MKISHAMDIGAVALLASGAASAQYGSMMNGGGWGMDWMAGYGGAWGPIVAIALIVGAVVLLLRRK
jgi:hypothetical protein